MLHAHHLSHRYGERTAVDGVSLQLPPGQITGLIGPNGAGKSTLVSMLAGLQAAHGGHLAWEGEAPLAPGDATAIARHKRRLGLAPQELALHEELSAQHNLELFGALYGLQGSALRTRVQAALAEVGLEGRAKDRPSSFSGGMKRRLNIACALVHAPQLLLLDEPTVGIDPQSRNAIFDHLERLRERGIAMLYTTHYMEEVERLCQHIVVVDQGRVIAQGTADALRALMPGGPHVHVTLAAPVNLGALQAAGFSAQHAPSAGAEADAAGRTHALYATLTPLHEELPRLLAAIAAQGVTLREIHTTRRSLEDVFLHLTGRALRDGEP